MSRSDHVVPGTGTPDTGTLDTLDTGTPGAAGAASAPSGGCPAHRAATALYGPRFQHSPGRVYREMRREHGPVARVLLEGGVEAWLVLGYRELLQVVTDSALFSRDSRRWNAWERGLIPDDWPLLPVIGYQPSVLYTEGEEHVRRARAVNDALRRVDLYELRDHAEQAADALVDDFCGSGEADLIAQYAHPLPLLVLTRLMGMPDAAGPDLARTINALVDGSEDATAARHFRTGMARLMAAKRRTPGPDLPSWLLAHPTGLTDEEVVQDLILLAVAGHQPTADWIGNTLRLMLTDDRFAASLTRGRRSVGQALQEVLWEDTPTQNFAGRWATKDTRLGGQRIRVGDLLVLGLAAANADPQVRPESPEGGADNHAHMSFGHGEHRCPYPAQEIAEVIAQAGVEVLLDRLPDTELAVPPDGLVWRQSAWLRGLTSLPVGFAPSHPLAAARPDTGSSAPGVPV